MVLRKKMIEEVRPFIGTDVVKVITGIRRCEYLVVSSVAVVVETVPHDCPRLK